MDAIERMSNSTDWVTFVLLFCWILLFFIKLHKPQYLLGYFGAFFTQGFIEKRVESSTFTFSFIQIIAILFVNTIISISIALYANTELFYDFVVIFGLVTTYLLIHYFISMIILKTFEIETEMRYFLFTKIGYLFTVCLWIFPFILLYCYAYKYIYLLSFFILVITGFRISLILKNNKKLVFSNLFYFILYLCALEIAPLLIVYKMIIT